MNNLKIIISTVNKKYGEALARGLLNQSSNLDISIISRENLDIEAAARENRIVMMDFHVETPEENVFYVDRRLKVSQIYSLLLEKVCESRHEVFQSSHPGLAKVIGFFSKEGGSGTTAAAITLGRMVSSRYGKKTLYLSLKAVEGYEVYAEADFSITKSKKELMLLLKRKLPADINVYTARDKYGLFYFKEEKNNSFFEESCENFKAVLSRLAADFDFDIIILDADESRIDNGYFVCSELFRIINAGDSRTLINNYKLSDSHVLINKASENTIEGKAFSVVEDRESFVNTGDSVIIAMDKSFAIGVKNIAEYVSEKW